MLQQTLTEDGFLSHEWERLQQGRRQPEEISFNAALHSYAMMYEHWLQLETVYIMYFTVCLGLVNFRIIRTREFIFHLAVYECWNTLSQNDSKASDSESQFKETNQNIAYRINIAHQFLNDTY